MSATVENWIRRRLLRPPLAERFDLFAGDRLVACLVPTDDDRAVARVLDELGDEIGDIASDQAVRLVAVSEGESVGELVLQCAPEPDEVVKAEIVEPGALDQMPLPSSMDPSWSKPKGPDPFKACADMLRTSQQTNLSLQRLLAEMACEGRHRDHKTIERMCATIEALERDKANARDERDELRSTLVAETMAADAIVQDERRKQDAWELLKNLAGPALSQKLGFPMPVTMVHRFSSIVEDLPPEARAEVMKRLTPEDIEKFGRVLDAHNLDKGDHPFKSDTPAEETKH